MADPIFSNWSDEQLLNFITNGKAPTAAETASDVAKSTGRGLANFAIGTAGLPGDVQSLAETGAAKLAGGEPQKLRDTMRQLGPSPHAPTSSDIQKTVEQWTGPLYQPQTPEGRYAASMASFAPAAVTGPIKTLPGRLLRMAAVPGAASEYAGDVLKGTPLEAPGKVAAALIAPTLMGRAINPLPVSEQHQGYSNLLRDEGVPLTAGDYTGRGTLRRAEGQLGQLPMAGSRYSDIKGAQGQKFVEAALRRVLPEDDAQWIDAVRASGRERARLSGEPDNLSGLTDQEILGLRNESDYGVAKPETIGVGRQYANQQIATGKAGTVLKFGQKQKDQVDDWAQRVLASGLPQEDQNGLIQMARNYVQGHVTGKVGQPAQMKGEAYFNLTQHNSDLSGMARGGGTQAKYAQELRDIIEEARKDAAFARGTGGGSMPRRTAYEAINEGRRAYGDVLAIEKAAGKGEGGIFTPSDLKTALQSQNRNAYNQGRGDLRDLAEAGKVALPPVSDSGTARNAYLISLPHSMAAATLGAATGSPTLTGTGMALAAVPPLTGRALMSKPVQWWLANSDPNWQGVRNALGATKDERVARLLAAQEATAPFRDQQIPYTPPLALPPP